MARAAEPLHADASRREYCCTQLFPRSSMSSRRPRSHRRGTGWHREPRQSCSPCEASPPRLRTLTHISRIGIQKNTATLSTVHQVRGERVAKLLTALCRCTRSGSSSSSVRVGKPSRSGHRGRLRELYDMIAGFKTGRQYLPASRRALRRSQTSPALRPRSSHRPRTLLPACLLIEVVHILCRPLVWRLFQRKLTR